MNKQHGKEVAALEGELIRSRVESGVARLPVIPKAPPNTFMQTLLGGKRSLLADAEFFRQHAERDRAWIHALVAQKDLLREFNTIGQLSVLFERDNQLREQDFRYETKYKEVLELELDEKAAALQRRIADHTAAIQKRVHEMGSADARSKEGSITTPQARVFHDALKHRDEIDRLYKSKLAEIETSALSRSEKDELRETVEKLLEQCLQMGDER